MLKTKMYVRCPADQESMYEPRIFVCGQIINIDEFKRTVSVKVHDPFGHLLFFEDLPKGVIELPLGSVDRCSFFIGSIVVYKGSSYKVLSCQKCKDDYYKYYIQNFDDTSVVKVPEADVIAAFNNGQVDPCVQLKNYEFQNPAWYLGRAVVAKSMDILENSIYGFKELAGSKIYLMPHQVNTIMRCLQESPCRYMLADEVGMGKTIEAISVYKIYTMNQSNKKALIVVPQVLKEQWISELLLKFNIPNGMGKNNNSVTVKTLQELSEKDLFTDWDFVIVDEVHKYLFSQSEYEKLHKISTLAKNILLLSATPVQQKKEEYLDLLRLLLPQKYNSFSVEKFGKLIAKQSKIIQKTALILDDLGDFEEEINSLAESAHDSEECEELFEEIHEDLEEICDELDDDKLNELLQQIKYENDDLGVYTIKVIISYICSNYQIESNIIRNRRKILESTDEDVQLMASRDLIELTYLTDNEGNPYEQLSYNVFAHWIIKGLESGILDVELDIKPLLSRFFSSPWAFYKQAKSSKMDGSILDNIRKWLESEQFNVDHMSVYLDYNASAPIDERVLDLMVEVYKNSVGNADSRTHNFGENARSIVENARKQVASLLQVKPDEIFFTSGATESNNIAIQGLKEYAEKSNRKHIITTAIEHKAVLETVKHLESEGFDVDIVSPDLTGRVSEEKILEKVKDNTLLVSVMHVNNETGIIQPVKEIGEKLQERGILFHIDATQSCGKLVEEIRSIKYDMLSFSAHKLMGPQGVGVLVLRKKSYKFPPVKAILYGGQQERGIRPGTLPVALVAGCGKACEIAESEYQRNIKHSQDLKNELLTVLDESGIQYHFNGEQNYCVPSTLNICIDGVSSEALMISTKQFCGVSNGSACTSKSYSPSYVLVAMGIATEQIESSIRISWGPNTDKEDALHNFKALLEIAKQIKS